MTKIERDKLAEILVNGLSTDGGHHKQYFLFKALELVDKAKFDELIVGIERGEIEDGFPD